MGGFSAIDELPDTAAFPCTAGLLEGAAGRPEGLAPVPDTAAPVFFPAFLLLPLLLPFALLLPLPLFSLLLRLFT